MRNLLYFVFGSSLLVGAVACSTSTGDDNSSNESDMVQAPEAREGEKCGGFYNTPCEKGLFCFFTPLPPGVLGDFAGKCVKAGSEGTEGGSCKIGKSSCSAGLDCVAQDGGATCVQPSATQQCPKSKHVNCAPDFVMGPKPDCESARREWVEANCPDVSYSD